MIWCCFSRSTVRPGFHRTGRRWQRDKPGSYLHMIEEYARHIGHADFLREQIDGATGE